ncbi:hypothetical protein NLJ89_g4894 [Agrocybe chaxingu]|uniref:F-box domain-containing protein n=1 Tax=Agrocybe chaxingu TaxID=84603 RepID=A0A9W8K392_9AGAR|nr:hypothetical protein NLJ89_g4894 [Agrocybe chaxingu]
MIPLEIVEHILSYLENADFRTLRACALTSRFFVHGSRKLLFRTFDLRDCVRYRPSHVFDSSWLRNRHIYRFITLLRTSPHLIRYIRNIFIVTMLRDGANWLEESALPSILLNLLSQAQIMVFTLGCDSSYTTKWQILHVSLQQSICTLLSRRTVVDLRLWGIGRVPLDVVALFNGLKSLTLNDSTFDIRQLAVKQQELPRADKTALEHLDIARCGAHLSALLQERPPATDWVPFNLEGLRSVTLRPLNIHDEPGNTVYYEGYEVVLWNLIRVCAASSLEKLAIVQHDTAPLLIFNQSHMEPDIVEHVLNLSRLENLADFICTARIPTEYLTSIRTIDPPGEEQSEQEYDSGDDVSDHAPSTDPLKRLEAVTSALRPCTGLLETAPQSLRRIQINLDLYGFTWREMKEPLQLFRYCGVEEEQIPAETACPWSMLDDALANLAVRLPNLEYIHLFVRVPDIEHFADEDNDEEMEPPPPDFYHAQLGDDMEEVKRIFEYLQDHFAHSRQLSNGRLRIAMMDADLEFLGIEDAEISRYKSSDLYTYFLSLERVEIHIALYAFIWREMRDPPGEPYAGVDEEHIPLGTECPWAQLDRMLADLSDLPNLEVIRVTVRLPDIEVLEEDHEIELPAQDQFHAELAHDLEDVTLLASLLRTHPTTMQ